MKTVWKYALIDGAAQQELILPCGAQPLHLDFQNGVLMLWALVDPTEQEKEPWTFWRVMTGQEFAPSRRSGLRYLGTMVRDGWFVRHYFARRGEI